MKSNMEPPLSGNASNREPSLPVDAPWLTVREFAKVERVHESTARRWVAEGRVPAYRIGRHYRIASPASRQARVAALGAPVRPSSDRDAG